MLLTASDFYVAPYCVAASNTAAQSRAHWGQQQAWPCHHERGVPSKCGDHSGPPFPRLSCRLGALVHAALRTPCCSGVQWDRYPHTKRDGRHAEAHGPSHASQGDCGACSTHTNCTLCSLPRFGVCSQLCTHTWRATHICHVLSGTAVSLKAEVKRNVSQ